MRAREGLMGCCGCLVASAFRNTMVFAIENAWWRISGRSQLKAAGPEAGAMLMSLAGWAEIISTP